MWRWLSFLLFSLVSGEILQTVTLDGNIMTDNMRPSSSASIANIRITLNGNQYTTLTRQDGGFTFYNIPSGIYLVDVHSIQHIYSQIKIKVIAESNSITAVEYKYPGAPRLPASYPLVFAPHVKLSYFQKKESISITKMVMGNPMMILMVVTFGVVVMFPKMLGVDKDQMKELMEQQKAQGIESDPTKAFQKLFGMDSKADEDD